MIGYSADDEKQRDKRTGRIIACDNRLIGRGFFKEILELHKRGGLGDGSPPAGSRGGAPVGGLGDEVPKNLKHIVVYCNKF